MRGTSTLIMTRHLRLACQAAAGEDWDATCAALDDAQRYAPQYHLGRLIRIKNAYLDIWFREFIRQEELND